MATGEYLVGAEPSNIELRQAIADLIDSGKITLKKGQTKPERVDEVMLDYNHRATKDIAVRYWYQQQEPLLKAAQARAAQADKESSATLRQYQRQAAAEDAAAQRVHEDRQQAVALRIKGGK